MTASLLRMVVAVLAAAPGIVQAATLAPEGDEHPGAVPYRRICFACHNADADHPAARGAPRLGSQRAWESRRVLGVETLFARITAPPHPNRMQMPRADLSDAELRQVIDYMLLRSERIEPARQSM